MNLTYLISGAQKLVRENSQTILTALGVSGTVTTAYLAHQAGAKKAVLIQEEKERLRDDQGRIFWPGRKHTLKLLWKNYIPSGISGVLTIGCIIGGAKVGAKKAAAAYSLLSVSEKAFSEYKDKVVEEIGEKKEQAIQDKIAQDRVTKGPEQGMLIVGPGNVLCYEMHTGRYFNSDMETLRRAQNTINAKMIHQMDASLSDFYYLVGLPQTSYSSMSGWDSDKMLELHFSTVMSEDGRPCIAFDYNYVMPF